MRQAEEEWFEANRANWNDRVAIHLSSTEYDQSKYIEDSEYISDVVSFDRERLGNIEGTRMVHLQCHIGNDTVSLARLGADVVGLDLSDKSIATAREFASAAGSNVEFFEGNVYDAPQILDRTFEFVYTSVGAINWLPDLDRWAKVVSDLLEPGGRFFIREGHPAIYPLDEQDGRLVHKYRYWSDRTTPMEWDESVSYFEGDGQITHTKCYEWPPPAAVSDQSADIKRTGH